MEKNKNLHPVRNTKLTPHTPHLIFETDAAKSKTHESRDKDEAMKTETNTTRSTYEIKENTHKTKSK
jgi:hypothetical protein